MNNQNPEKGELAYTEVEHEQQENSVRGWWTEEGVEGEEGVEYEDKWRRCIYYYKWFLAGGVCFCISCRDLQDYYVYVRV